MLKTDFVKSCQIFVRDAKTFLLGSVDEKKFYVLKKGQVLEFVNKNKIGCIHEFRGDTMRNK